MARPSLEGRSILVVEDQPLVALDITQQFEAAGAALTTTNTLHHALILVEHDGLSGAILDHALGDGDSSLLCTRLRERGIPFMIYSGYDTIEGPCKDALHICKPAADGALVAAMKGLLMSDAIAKIEIGPLPVEQRRIADEYRSVEKVLQAMHKSLSTKTFDRATRAETEASIVTRTAELMRLGQQMLDLDTFVNYKQ
jgi:DNA-binding response OmpR family regulator